MRPPPAAGGRRRGAACTSSAARCATCCSAGSRVSSTSSSRAMSPSSRRRSAVAPRRTSASARRPSPTATAGGISPRRARRSTRGPGALPDVRPAPIDEDLERRDVTVNAIALDLRSGELRAVDHALDDLAARRLRVLHEVSFSDDPTRLWRIARYAARLGFELEAHTARLAEQAVAAGVAERVSGPRIGSELRLALGEPDPLAALEQAVSLGLAPWLQVDRERAAAALELLPAGEGRRDLVLLACCIGESGDDADQRLAGLGFTAAERAVLRAAARAPEVAAAALQAERASQLARVMRALPVEAVAVAGAHGAGEPARRWLQELRHVRARDRRRRPAGGGRRARAAGRPAAGGGARPAPGRRARRRPRRAARRRAGRGVAPADARVRSSGDGATRAGSWPAATTTRWPRCPRAPTSGRTVRSTFRRRSSGSATTSAARCRGVACCSRRAAAACRSPPYDTLNLGVLTDDDRAAVDANRDRLAALIGIARERTLQGWQVHATTVRRVHELPAADAPLAEADGQATALEGVAAVVLTADCLPVALVAAQAVAIVHAGWRGLAGGVIAEGVAALRELGAHGDDPRRDRSRRRRLLLRDRAGGPRRVRRVRRAGAPRRARRPQARRSPPAARRRRRRGARQRDLHDVRAARACSSRTVATAG